MQTGDKWNKTSLLKIFNGELAFLSLTHTHSVPTPKNFGFLSLSIFFLIYLQNGFSPVCHTSTSSPNKIPNVQATEANEDTCSRLCDGLQSCRNVIRAQKLALKEFYCFRSLNNLYVSVRMLTECKIWCQTKSQNARPNPVSLCHAILSCILI